MHVISAVGRYGMKKAAAKFNYKLDISWPFCFIFWDTKKSVWEYFLKVFSKSTDRKVSSYKMTAYKQLEKR